MSGPKIPKVEDLLREALKIISLQLYDDVDHWCQWLALLCQRIRDVANAGATKDASTLHLPRNIGKEITEVANRIIAHANLTFASSPPFTAPRLAELLLCPEIEGYLLNSEFHVLNYLNALLRTIMVSSTVLDFDDMVALEEPQPAPPPMTKLLWHTDVAENSNCKSSGPGDPANTIPEKDAVIIKNMEYETQEIQHCLSPEKSATKRARIENTDDQDNVKPNDELLVDVQVGFATGNAGLESSSKDSSKSKSPRQENRILGAAFAHEDPGANTSTEGTDLLQPVHGFSRESCIHRKPQQDKITEENELVKLRINNNQAEETLQQLKVDFLDKESNGDVEASSRHPSAQNGKESPSRAQSVDNMIHCEDCPKTMENASLATDGLLSSHQACDCHSPKARGENMRESLHAE